MKSKSGCKLVPCHPPLEMQEGQVPLQGAVLRTEKEAPPETNWRGENAKPRAAGGPSQNLEQRTREANRDAPEVSMTLNCGY